MRHEYIKKWKVNISKMKCEYIKNENKYIEKDE